MVNFYSALRARWRALTAPTREAICICVAAVAIWVLIERTETCDRFFDWVEANPDAEADSAILAFILAAIGVTVFAVRRYLELGAANRAREAAERQARALAYHDPLTGLPNRHALTERLNALMAQDSGLAQLGLIIFDLDRFKPVNDVHGHAAGDRVLRLVAERFRREQGNGQAFYRLGGDEFACIVEMAAREDDAPAHLARRCIAAICDPIEDRGLVHHIGASAGIAIFPSDARDRETLMRHADLALYRAKDEGRCQYRSFEPKMDASIRRRAEIEARMRNAIALGGFRPHYQPIVDLMSGAVTGYELLARWIDCDGEAITPDEFIPIAEESGLINELMLLLIDQACREARDWDPSLTVAVNVSPTQLKDPWLSQKVLAALARHGFPPQRLTIEITENALIGDAENAKRTIESFKNQGMQIGLDDFGTGYSSLQHLRMLPFDKIKIDRSFVMAIGRDPEALKIVRAINSLAQSLELPVVAEGIESAETAEVLRQLGCALGQGYYFGKAMPCEAVEAGRNIARADIGGAARAPPVQHVHADPVRTSLAR